MNRLRLQYAPDRKFSGKSSNALELKANPGLELDYIFTVPRMARYMEVSSRLKCADKQRRRKIQMLFG